jgi:hypothetical protein
MRLRNTSRDPRQDTHDARFMGAAIEKSLRRRAIWWKVDRGPIALEV